MVGSVGPRIQARFDKNLNQPINHNAEAFLFLEVDGLASYKFSSLHAPGELMEDRALEITKDLDCAQKLIQIAREARLDPFVMSIREQVDVRLFALGLWWQSRVHVEDAVSHNPAHRGDDARQNEHPGLIVSELPSDSGGPTYRVVAFMVTVQLVENKVKRMVGTLIVTIRMTQYRTVVIRFNSDRISRPNKPSQLVDPWAAVWFARALMLGEAKAWETLLEREAAICVAFSDAMATPVNDGALCTKRATKHEGFRGLGFFSLVMEEEAGPLNRAI